MAKHAEPSGMVTVQFIVDGEIKDFHIFGALKGA
jgi:hypothetical protein